MSAGAARGPLSSALAQWTVIGVGGLNLVGNESFTDNVLKGAQLVMGLPLTGSIGAKQAPVASAQQPIVIHTGGSNSSSSEATTNAKIVASLVQVCIGASICWGSYLVMSNFLPDSVKEMLPVTRKFFDKAVTSLANGILEVKEQLTDQINTLLGKQKELSDKQDATHNEVLNVKDDLGDMRLDLGSMHHTLDRCESSLSEAERKQTYTARGVRLLVKCVGAILPRNADLTTELESFSKLGEEIHNDNDAEKKNDGSSQQMMSQQQIQYQQQQQQMMMMQQMQSPPPIPHLQHQMMSPQYRQHSNSQQFTPIVTATATPATSSSTPSERSSTVTSPTPSTTMKKEVSLEGPENETPKSAGLEDVRALLTMVRGGEVTVQTVQ
mmetsp:Transcript_13177/g.18649  ORF Transcript_13177/g.18649 Transcript_13177/m.18649 type:complete len:382 (+) Transcript_13177:376-1521(+)